MHEEVADERMKLVAMLIGRIVELGEQFKIYPPNEALQEPEILKNDQAAEKLAGTQWRLSLSDGREETLSFTELIVLSYELAVVQAHLLKAQADPSQPVEVDFRFKLEELMTPEHVKTLLGKLTFEGLA